MPFPLKPISLKFRADVLNLKDIFDREWLKPKTFERDLLIEACFLKSVIAWEEFIENYTLTCLCEGEIRRGVIIKPKRGISVCQNLHDAFKSLKSTRVDWYTYYYDWLKPNSLEEKIIGRFDPRSRLHSVYSDRIKHNQIIVLRNAIAHSSRKTIKLLEGVFITLIGYIPYTSLSVKPVDFLIETDITGRAYFHILIDFYVYLEDKLMRS
jgi:hypothetical protein